MACVSAFFQAPPPATSCVLQDAAAALKLPDERTDQPLIGFLLTDHADNGSLAFARKYCFQNCALKLMTSMMLHPVEA